MRFGWLLYRDIFWERFFFGLDSKLARDGESNVRETPWRGARYSVVWEEMFWLLERLQREGAVVWSLEE